MLSKSFALIVLVLVVASCKPTNKERWERINSNITYLDTLGAESDSIFFSFPEFVVTDSLNNIVVGDPGLSKLLVFNRDFEFSHTIGNRGRGPKEFINIEGLAIDSNDQITVFDRSQQMMKIFNVDGHIAEAYSTKLLESHTVIIPYKGGYILVYLGDGENNELVHFINSDFSKFYSHSLPLADLQRMEDENAFSGLFGRAGSTLLIDNKLYYSPTTYNGYIYELTFDPLSKKFDLTREIEGRVFFDPIETITQLNNKNIYVDARFSSGNEVSGILHRNWSLGLFQVSSGEIYHFAYVENKDGNARELVVERYDENFNPLGYGVILEKRFSSDIKQSRLLNWDIPWMDKQDRFYIIDREGEVPLIKIMKLNFD